MANAVVCYWKDDGDRAQETVTALRFLGCECELRPVANDDARRCPCGYDADRERALIVLWSKEAAPALERVTKRWGGFGPPYVFVRPDTLVTAGVARCACIRTWEVARGASVRLQCFLDIASWSKRLPLEPVRLHGAMEALRIVAGASAAIAFIVAISWGLQQAARPEAYSKIAQLPAPCGMDCF